MHMHIGAQTRRVLHNWPLLQQRLRTDSHTAEVIWHAAARGELCAALAEEEGAFARAQELHGAARVAWNDEEFAVSYPSLAHEVPLRACCLCVCVCLYLSLSLSLSLSASVCLSACLYLCLSV